MTALYGLAEHCKYGSLQSEMIRDRIVVGLHDRKLSERLQLEAGQPYARNAITSVVLGN